MATVAEELAKLNATLAEKRANGVTKGEMQFEDFAKQYGDKINELVAAQVKAIADAQPVRPGVAGEPINVRNDELKGNRYAPFVKSFAQGQQHKNGGQSFTPTDLAIAYSMLQGQAKSYHPSQGGGVAQYASDDLRTALKAMDSTTAGAGDEYVPTNLAAMLWDDFFLASRVVNGMQRIDMPTNPFDVPLGLGAVTWRKGSENTATTASNPPTAKSTLTATELVTEQAWSYTLDEDAIIAMAPAIRARLAQSGGEIMDDFALNADATATSTGNINLDNDTPAATAYYLTEGQDGIRHQWLVNHTAMGNSAGGDALTDADITGLLAEMGKYAVDPNQLILVCDVNTYLNGFLQTGTGKPGEYVATIDKIGSDAIILRGQLASYRGIPIVVSASHPLTQADGKANDTGNTLGSFSVMNRNMWYAGFRRNLMMEVDRDIQRRQYIMVTSLRMAVAAHGTRSTATHTGGVYNILV
jgi:HK97 family phage major capsid protein